MHPILIIEGADGTGKSTLAQAIVAQYGAHYIHCVYTPNVIGSMSEYVEGVLDAAVVLADFFPVVIDRWRVSEEVYSNVYREGRVEGGHEDTERLISMADELGITFIFCQPENKELYLEAFDATKHDRKEMYMEGMGNVYDEYAKQIAWIEKFLPDTPIIIYDRFDPALLNGVNEYADILMRNAYDETYVDVDPDGLVAGGPDDIPVGIVTSIEKEKMQ